MEWILPILLIVTGHIVLSFVLTAIFLAIEELA